MNEEGNIKVERIRIKRKYPLPRSDISFGREIELIKAIAEFSEKGSKAIDYKSVKIGVHPTVVSSELRYFESLGLVKKGENGKYYVDAKVTEFADNMNWKKESEAKKILRDIVKESWFGNLTIKIIKIRGKIKKDELLSELGKEASAHPTKDKKSIERLIEWMEYCELINIDENQNITLKIPQEIVETKEQRGITIKEEIIHEKLPIQIVFEIIVTSQTSEEEIVEILKKIKRVLKSGE
jgi:hypothetical protein